MKFTPKTQKELDEEKLLPAGEYDFEISGGEDAVSKNGNEMIKLLVRIYKPDGNFILVNDYLLESMAYKLRHAAETCGLLDRYESGNLLGADFIGKTGKLKLKIDAGKGDFPAKNVVGDYIVPKAAVIDPNAPPGYVAPPKTATAPTTLIEDEIPF